MNYEAITKAMAYINSRLTEEELLAQLAEEAAELTHAALKMRRVMEGTNPTPVTHEEAREALLEEVADVTLLLDLLRLNQIEIDRITIAKLARWQRRLLATEGVKNADT